MGTPLPENPPGEDGPRCWGPGKAFGDHPTPQIVTITLIDLIRDVQATDAIWNELTLPHQLYQTVNPLIWDARNDNLWWRYLLNSPVGRIEIGTPFITLAAFFNTSFDECGTTAINELDVPIGELAWGGFFEMTFNGVFS